MFLTYLPKLIRRFVKDEEAASAIEYAIVVAMAAAVAAAFMSPISIKVKEIFQGLKTALGIAD